MKKFHLNEGTHIKAKNTTKIMRIHLFLALLPILFFGWYQKGILPFTKGEADVFKLFYPLILLFIPAFTTFLLGILYGILMHKKNPFSYAFEENRLFGGLLFGLLIPLNTPIYLIILSCLLGSVISKIISVIFKRPIFQTSLLSYFFLFLIFEVFMGNSLLPEEITPLMNLKNIEGIGTYSYLVKPYGSLWNFLFSNFEGVFGFMAPLLSFLAYFYLVWKKEIKWKIPMVFVLTVFGMTFMIGNYHTLGIWYPFFQIMTGGLIFSAVFLAADSTSSPVTPVGEVLYGFFLGILTVTFRYLVPVQEGVLFSILILSLFLPFFDHIGSKARFHFMSAVAPFFLVWTLILGLGMFLGMTTKTTETVDKNFFILQKEGKEELSYLAEEKWKDIDIKVEALLINQQIVSFTTKKEAVVSPLEKEELIKNQNKLEPYMVSNKSDKFKVLVKLLMNVLEDAKKVEEPEEIPEEKEEEKTEPFEIFIKEETEETTVYTVSERTKEGNVKLELSVDASSNVVEIKILEWNFSYPELTEEEILSVIEKEESEEPAFLMLQAILQKVEAYDREEKENKKE